MDLQYRLVIQLKERLGYKEQITLTRDEFNLLIDGDLGLVAELQKEIDELNSDLEDFKDYCNCDEIRKNLEELSKIIKDNLKGSKEKFSKILKIIELE